MPMQQPLPVPLAARPGCWFAIADSAMRQDAEPSAGDLASWSHYTWEQDAVHRSRLDAPPQP